MLTVKYLGVYRYLVVWWYLAVDWYFITLPYTGRYLAYTGASTWLYFSISLYHSTPLYTGPSLYTDDCGTRFDSVEIHIYHADQVCVYKFQLTEINNYVAEMDNLKSVTLRNCALVDSSFQNIALSLQVTQSNPNLLNYSENQLGARSLAPLAIAIKNKPSIEIVM